MRCSAKHLSVVAGILLLTLPLVSSTGEQSRNGDLIEAARRGDAAQVRALISSGVDANAKDSAGRTALHWAVFENQEESVRALLEAGADVNAAEPDGTTALHHAAAYSNANVVRALLARGADANAALPQTGTTVLMVAAGRDQAEVVEALLAAGARPTTKDAEKATALHYAAREGHSEVIRKLVAARVKIDAEDLYKTTPVVITLARGHTDAFYTLLEAGAEGADYIYLPLVAAHYGNHQAVRAMVQNSKYEGEAQWMALLIFAAAGREGPLRTLLDGGVNVKAEETSGDLGWQPLVTAAALGRTSVVRLLLERGADVNVRDSMFDATPLMAATFLNHPEIVEILLKAKPDLEAAHSGGWTAWSLAFFHGHDAIRRQLERAGAKRTTPPVQAEKLNDPLFQLSAASRRGDAATIQALLKNGADPNRWPEEDERESSQKGVTIRMLPLQWAVAMGHREAVRALLEGGAGPNPDIRGKDELGITAPLVLAVALQRTEILKNLLQATTLPAPPSGTYADPLMAGAGLGRMRELQMLLASGEDINRRDNELGTSALFAAIFMDQTETVELLLAHGASVTSQSLDFAGMMGYLDILEMLKIQAGIN